MLFRKRKQPAERPTERRIYYRPLPVDPETLSALLQAPGGWPVEARVHDLTLGGVGLLVHFAQDPNLAEGDVVDIEMRCRSQDWTIRTPAQVRHQHQADELHFHYGLQFLNMGNLYAQMEEAFGRYFNRRNGVRVKPQLDRELTVGLRYEHHSMRGPLHDISASGMGISLGHVEAAPLRLGGEVKLRFTLPDGNTPLETYGTIQHKRQLGQRDYIGLEFDLTRSSALTERAQELHDYLDSRLKAMAAFHQKLGASGG